MSNILEICATSDGTYTVLPTPSMDGYECTPNEINKASRNAFGNLYKYRINIKRSITVQWNALSHDDFQSILSLTSSNYFYLRYWDLQEQKVRTGKFYRGNDLKMTGKPPFKDDKFSYYVLSMSFEEF